MSDKLLTEHFVLLSHSFTGSFDFNLKTSETECHGQDQHLDGPTLAQTAPVRLGR